MFKIGDRVKCVDDVDAEGVLVKGKVYTVTDVNFPGEMISLEGMGMSAWFWDRFIIVSGNGFSLNEC